MRHWLVLVLAAQIFLPHAHSVWVQLAVLPVVLVVLCGALALTETLTAKMRILLAPRLLALGGIAALLGVASLAGAAHVSGALVWLLVALGLGVVVVRRRSLAVALVTVQALVLAVSAAQDKAAAARQCSPFAPSRSARSCCSSSRARASRVRCGPASRRSRAPGSQSASRSPSPGSCPSIGLDSRNAERGVLALIAFGIAAAATRRATLFQVLGIVLVRERARAGGARAAGRLVDRDRAGRRLRPDARRARRRGVPRKDLRRVRRRRHGRAAEPA